MSSYRPDRHRAFVAGIAYHQSFAAMVIGGVHDHVHALLLLPPSLALAEAIQILKGSSSKWINETNCTTHYLPGGRATPLSVSVSSQAAGVVRYLQNPQAHHEKESVAEEFVDFLKYGVSYDPVRVLGWLCRHSVLGS